MTFDDTRREEAERCEKRAALAYMAEDYADAARLAYQAADLWSGLDLERASEWWSRGRMAERQGGMREALLAGGLTEASPGVYVKEQA